ncbi:hypothetical protein QJS04_geneDACA016285 [Acorus gramineus]|uniref:Uncharacterized protein n=1 Tax=Acorus gramineus TaxID=55184 RepID=A0AAV8ZZA1_ACOGR|nr:hypothetical protein QJS04_geneDACA016285 [Acorus gramineus]
MGSKELHLHPPDWHSDAYFRRCPPDHQSSSHGSPGDREETWKLSSQILGVNQCLGFY